MRRGRFANIATNRARPGERRRRTARPIIPPGAIAQLAERRTRIAEVESSSLFRSTTPGSTTPVRLLAVVLVTVQDGRRSVRAGIGRCRPWIVGVHEGFLDVRKGRADLVA